MTSGTADQSGSTTSIPEPHKTRIKMINRVLDLAESHDIAANALACNAVPYEFTGDQHKDAADAIQALIDMVGATVARHDPDLHRHITERLALSKRRRAYIKAVFSGFNGLQEMTNAED